MKVKASSTILGLLLSLAVAAQPSVGATTPEISLKDVNGKTVALSSLRGKVVLLDFWASWCGPCRRENKHLVNVYSKFKARGFEIYSISLDEEAMDWKQAIQQDRITWLQVIDGGQVTTASKWNIQQIPTTFLIDKEGKVVARDLEAKQLESKLKALLK